MRHRREPAALRSQSQALGALTFMTPATSARYHVALLAAMATVCFAQAEELTFREVNCALSVPPGWNKWPVNQTNYYALLKSPDELKTLVFTVRPAKGVRVVDEAFARELRDGFVASGAALKVARHVSISGVPAYEFGGEMLFEGKKVSTISRVFIAAGKAYKLNAMYMEGDVLSDPDLQQCLNSFRFLKPPTTSRAPKVIFGGLAGISLLLLALILRGGLTHLGAWQPTVLYLNLVAWVIMFALHAFWCFARPSMVPTDSLQSVASIFGVFAFLSAGVSISWLMQRRWSPYLGIILSIVCALTLWKLHFASLVLTSRGDQSFAALFRNVYSGMNALWLIELLFLAVSIPFWAIYSALRKRKYAPELTAAQPDPSPST
jgi:hypothetical protein